MKSVAVVAVGLALLAPAPTSTPTATVSADPDPTFTPDPEPPDVLSPPLGPPRSVFAPLLADRRAPRVTASVPRRAAAPASLSVDERAIVTATLRMCRPACRTTRRTFSLAAGRHALTARRLAGRARLPRGRYALTLRVRDPAGNAAPARVVHFSV